LSSQWLAIVPALFLQSGWATPSYRVVEKSIAEIHEAMQSEPRLTALRLVEAYLARIEAYDKQGPFLNSIITVNPKAMEIAARLDEEYAKSGFVGPLHGIPVILKDNYDTHDMPTTNGNLALEDSIPPDDAFIVRKLREAGAIILAKANMAEFSSSGFFTLSSVLPGYTRNPYDIRRTTSGSSGGPAAAIAASFGAVGLGTDTGGSIRGPAAHQCLVGIRSTMGLTSRDGIIPASTARDIGGPMARSVADAVAVLEVIAGYDPADPVTVASQGKVPDNYRQYLVVDGLRGARIGVVRQMFDEQSTDRRVLELMSQALQDMEAAGATIIDPADIPDLEVSKDTSERQYRKERPERADRLKYDVDRYLASLGPDAPYKSLQEIFESGKYHPFLEKRLAEAVAFEGAPEDHPKHQESLEKSERLRQKVLGVMDDLELDALVYPTFHYPPRLLGDLNTPRYSNNTTLGPPTGFPAITVPMGFTYGELPAGIQFLGRPFDEPTLIRLSYSYEQATQHRMPPTSTPPLQ
jgi:Asp-tRNA(Asn)/Glu-tRNA(Gln) amidotransferase A subunit family amidase